MPACLCLSYETLLIEAGSLCSYKYVLMTASPFISEDRISHWGRVSSLNRIWDQIHPVKAMLQPPQRYLMTDTK